MASPNRSALVLGSGPLVSDVAQRLAASGRYQRVSRLAFPNTDRASDADDEISVMARGAEGALADRLLSIAPTHILHLGGTSVPGHGDDPGAFDTRLAAVLATAVRRWHRHGGRPRHLTFLSSTSVYGVAVSSPLLFCEEDPVATTEPYSQSSAARWAAGLRRAEASIDAMAGELGLALAVLRSAHVVGEGAVSPLTEFLAERLPTRPLGFDPPVQVVHLRDLAEAVVTAAETDARGVLNIVGRGTARLSRVAALLGVLVPPLPGPLSDRFASPLGPARLRWRCIADGRRAVRVLGFHSSLKIEEALRA